MHRNAARITMPRNAVKALFYSASNRFFSVTVILPRPVPVVYLIRDFSVQILTFYYFLTLTSGQKPNAEKSCTQPEGVELQYCDHSDFLKKCSAMVDKVLYFRAQRCSKNDCAGTKKKNKDKNK